jgi:hypothetical protein
VVETAGFFDGEQLSGLPFVRHVRQDGSRQLTVVVDDAGTATPDVVEAVKARGGEVVSAREERPSFDDVFAALVQRDERERATAEVADGVQARDESSKGDERTDMAAPVETPAALEPPPPTDQPRPDAEEAEWRPSEEVVASAPGEPNTPAADSDREASR